MLTTDGIKLKIKVKESKMKKERKVKRYIKTTTFAQRKLMIETYQKTHNISFSCRKARVSINTFRRWYPRYLEQGMEGIRRPKKHILWVF